MKRRLHLALALCAMVAHLGAPVAAYAQAATHTLPGDFCSASRSGAKVSTGGGLRLLVGSALPLPAGGGLPAPVSGEHHCAHAPCCAGGASDAATLPPAPVVFRAALASVRAPKAPPVILLSVVTAAAQPRGPPLHA